MSDKIAGYYEGIQWTIGQIFPELIHPGHGIEKGVKKPTTTATLMFNTTLRAQGGYATTTEGVIIETPNRKGTAWAYFAPYNDFLLMHNPSNVSTDMIQTHSAFFSSSAGPVPENDTKTFHWNEIAQNDGNKSDSTIGTYKELRINSAAIVIKQLAPVRDYSGILRVGFGYKGMIQGMDSFDFSDFDKHFTMTKTINLAKESDLVVRYRLPFNKYDKFGPYDPTTPVPYFFILAEGVPPESSLDITIIRHIEGVPNTMYKHFTHQYHAPSYAADPESQKKTINATENIDNIFEAYADFTPINFKPNNIPAENFTTLVSIIDNNPEYKNMMEAVNSTFASFLAPSTYQANIEGIMHKIKEKSMKLKIHAPDINLNEIFNVTPDIIEPNESIKYNISKWSKVVMDKIKNSEYLKDLTVKDIVDFITYV